MKIYELNELGPIVEILKEDGNTIVQCHGCFDLLHLGHVKHLQAAKKLGDILIVTVTADEFVNKGEGRPIFTEDDRAAMIEALDCVDFVAINNASDATEAILILKPNKYVKGIDYRGLPPDFEHLSVHKIGGSVVYTLTEKLSSTELIESHMQ